MLNRIDIDGLKKFIESELMKTFKAQGHFMTGDLIDSIKWEVEQNAETLLISMFMKTYGIYLDAGVKSSKIPYTEGSGDKYSKYIQGMIGYVKSRITSDNRKAKSIAFAIAKTQKKEGMPTRASYRFTSNGYRTRFMTTTIQNKSTLIEQQLGMAAEKYFIGNISNRITNIISKFAQS